MNSPTQPIISSSKRASQWLQGQIKGDQEEVWVLGLAANKKLIEGRMIFRGTADACLVHPRDIFRFVFETNSVGFIVCHNHPSGETRPSIQDWQFTDLIQRCAMMFQIPLLDHLIVTSMDYQSLRALRPEAFASGRCWEEMNQQVCGPGPFEPRSHSNSHRV